MISPKRTGGVAVILLALLSSTCTKGDGKPADYGLAALALFQRFETVFYAKADLFLVNGAYKQLPEQVSNALRLPFLDLHRALDALGPRASAEVFENADAVLVGAKDFRPPGGLTGLGGVRSRSCYVVMIRDSSAFQIRRFMARFPASSQDARTWKWLVEQQEGEGKAVRIFFYASQISPAYLVISSDLEETQAVTAKLSGNNSIQELNSIRDWKEVRQHEIWGYRRYRPTESMNKSAAGTLDVMPGAEALALLIDVKGKSGTLRLYGTAAATADRINSHRILPPFKVTGEGVWETAVPLVVGDRGAEGILAVMGLFGYGVYL